MHPEVRTDEQPQIQPEITLTTSVPASHGVNPAHVNGGHRPDHLKWGDIVVSGFAPRSLNGNEDANLENLCQDDKTDKEVQRWKMSRDQSMELLDSEARRIHSQRRYLFRRPRALQYFRGRVLVRSDEERSSGRLELFFDLTFVGIIAVLAEETIAEPTGASLVRYLITYTAAYLVWS